MFIINIVCNSWYDESVMQIVLVLYYDVITIPEEKPFRSGVCILWY